MDNNKIVIGNMKMNLTFDTIKEYIKVMDNSKNFVICPSSIYIPYFINAGFDVGIQNISEYGLGTYTGEISVNQASSMGVKYAIVGHSDRRDYFHESDDVVNRKMRKAVSNNLISILCIGESLEEKMLGKTREKVKKQILEDLDGVDSYYYKNILIAYEPVWAIGTGKVPSKEEIMDIVSYIKRTINNNFGFIPPVIYGGSVNEHNIDELNSIDNLDGFLVGGACLRPEKMKKIIETIN